MKLTVCSKVGSVGRCFDRQQLDPERLQIQHHFPNHLVGYLPVWLWFGPLLVQYGPAAALLGHQPETTLLAYPVVVDLSAADLLVVAAALPADRLEGWQAVANLALAGRFEYFGDPEYRPEYQIEASSRRVAPAQKVVWCT